MSEEEKNDPNTILEFKVDKLIKKEYLEEFKVLLKVSDEDIIETVHQMEEMKATPENMISSKVYFINQQIFDIVKML